MNWNLIAAFLAPIITALIAFFLNKFFQSKPELIAYYGHVSSHKIPTPNAYPINFIKLTDEPNKEQLDIQFRDKVPLIIKNRNNIWIYGHDDMNNTVLTKSDDHKIYNEDLFTENITLLTFVPHEIYHDISSNKAHKNFIYVGTHTVVVRNSGKLPTKNVRLGHKFLPNYSVIPSTKYETTILPAGGIDISFPVLVPNEQVTVSYLYFAPTTYADINTYVKSDDGLAKIIEAIPNLGLAVWLKGIIYALAFIGCWVTIYIIINFTIFIFRYWCCLS